MVKSSAVFVLHLLLDREIRPLRGLVLQIHVAEVAEVDVHFADGPQQFGAVQRIAGLRGEGSTCTAEFFSVNSTKSLVTSPFSKMRTLMMEPYLENFS
jgi:hypothetical protein